MARPVTTSRAPSNPMGRVLDWVVPPVGVTTGVKLAVRVTSLAGIRNELMEAISETSNPATPLVADMKVAV